MPKIASDDKRFWECEQCLRPLGYEKYRVRVKDNKHFHVVCLEYMMRELKAWPAGPPIAHHMESRAKFLKGWSFVYQEKRR